MQLTPSCKLNFSYIGTKITGNMLSANYTGRNQTSIEQYDKAKLGKRMDKKYCNVFMVFDSLDMKRT